MGGGWFDFGEVANFRGQPTTRGPSLISIDGRG